MNEPCAIVLFRDDFRVSDHAALFKACTAYQNVICVYIRDETDPLLHGNAAKDFWLQRALHDLNRALSYFSGQENALNIFQGDPTKIIADIAQQHNAVKLFAHKRYFKHHRAQDDTISEIIPCSFSDGQLLTDPEIICNKSGTPFKVFTPFWKHIIANIDIPKPADMPNALRQKQIHFVSSNNSQSIDDLALYPMPAHPHIEWANGFTSFWGMDDDQSLEKTAREFLKTFIGEHVTGYKENRDRPDMQATSRLSPFLANGQISARQIFHYVRTQQAAGADENGCAKFLSELGWREFSYHLLYHFPELKSDPMNAKFAHFPWRDEGNPECIAMLKAWQQGQTGYPIVDAGMRELWQTGWMHNRVRMVVGSFLVKHLRIHWHYGMKWFWDTLVDADHANNTASWQWIAGCGADAAPYFRIFNPMTQGQKFDPNGDYVRKYCPELSALPNKYIHEPWAASDEILKSANVELGQNYPKPIVDHKKARQDALDAFQELKNIEI